MATRKIPTEKEKFWLEIGLKLGQAMELKDRFERFIDNDFRHLERKVDKISWKVALIVGGVTGAFWVLQLIFKFIKI